MKPMPIVEYIIEALNPSMGGPFDLASYQFLELQFVVPLWHNLAEQILLRGDFKINRAKAVRLK